MTSKRSQANCLLNITSAQRGLYVFLFRVYGGTPWNSFPTCLKVVASLNLVKTIHASNSYLVDLLPHIWPPARKIPCCFISARQHMMLIPTKDYALLCFMRLQCEDRFLSLALRQTLARPLLSCCVFWTSRCFSSGCVFLYCEAFSFFYEMCGLPYKVHHSASLYDFASCFLQWSHSRPRFWSVIFHIAPFGTLDPLYFTWFAIFYIAPLSFWNLLWN